MSDYRSANIMNTDGSNTVNVGLKDNNPGDIKYDGTQWQGMATPNTDGTFVIFVDTTWGLRAIGMDLQSKIDRDGLNTITEIVNAYAPASDNNNVSAYISSLVSDTGFAADQVLTADPDTLALLIRGIVNHEIGDELSSTYVSDSDIQTAIGMMNSVTAAAQAAVIYAQQNPIMVIGAVVVGVVLLGMATRSSKSTS